MVMQNGIVTGPVETNERRRRWALFVVLLGQFMLVLDTSIVSIALRAIQSDLGMRAADLTWVTTAYLIAFGGLLLLFGRLSDLLGRRRVFLLGLWVFTIASVACGLATSPLLLILSRFAQGIGAAASSSVTLAIIAVEFAPGPERVRAMSAYSLVSVCGGSVGLLLGGLLTEAATWHSIFLINVPIGLIAVRLGGAFLQEDVAPQGDRRVDVAGAVLVTAGAMSLIYALVAMADTPWSDPFVWGSGLAALLLLGAFGALQPRLANPLMPPRIWAIKSLMTTSIVRACMVMALYGVWFLGALELAHALGFGPKQIGFAFLPQTLSVALLALGPTPKLVNKFGARRVLIVGLSIFVVGIWSLAQHAAGLPYFPWRFVSYLLMGLGSGFSFMPLVVLAMADVPARDAGLGSAIINVSQQLAAAFGLAVLGSIAAYRTQQLGAAPSALIDGFHTAYTVATVTVLAGLLVAVFGLRKRSPVTTTDATFARAGR
jgi:EmrB/QacA subfamily drug resistance transporter